MIPEGGVKLASASGKWTFKQIGFLRHPFGAWLFQDHVLRIVVEAFKLQAGSESKKQSSHKQLASSLRKA